MAGASFFFGVSAIMASVVNHETGDRRRVLQRDPDDLSRIDDAGVQHVDILFSLRVKAEGLRLVLEDLADDDRTFNAGIFGRGTH
jgi:hypothetical protein